MIRVRNLFLLYFLMYTLGCPLHCQDKQSTRYSTYKTLYTLRDSVSGILCSIQAVGETFGDEDYFMIPFNTLYRIGEPKLELMRPNGSWKPVRNVEYLDQELELDHFYSDSWIRQIKVPAASRFRISIDYSIEDFFLFPQVPLSSPLNLDSLSVRVDYPAEYSFSHRFNNCDGDRTIHIDSLQSENRKQFSVRMKPHRYEPVYFSHPEFRRYQRSPSLNCLILPPSYNGREDQYLNTWYNRQVETVVSLSEESREQLFHITGGSSDVDSLISRLSNELKRRMKYLDVEIGMGSIRPGDPNETLQKLQGDCKDMSHLLCSALRLHGVDAHMALASTWFSNADLDFPVLSAGDHMVSAIFRKGQWQFIDLTEKYGNIEYPGRAIQNRHLYITGQNLGTIVRVEAVTPDSNRIHWELDMSQAPDGLHGTFRLRIGGIAMSNVRELWAASPKGSDIGIQLYLELFTEKMHFDSLTYSDLHQFIEISGKARTLNNPIAEGHGTRYFRQDFLPYPHPFPRKIQDKIQFNEHTLMQDLDMKLTLSKALTEFPGSDYHHHTEYSSIESRTSSEESHILRISYDFELNEIEFKGQAISDYNQLNNTLNSYFNNVLILQ